MNKPRGDAETRRKTKKTLRPVAASSHFGAPPITLLTDFGNADYFVGAMKGVILSRNPNAQIVDLSHEIPPQDIEAAAFTLLAAHSCFPAGSIHVAVVDPGVGSDRRPLLIEVANQYFVGPDNGIFSYVCDEAELNQKPIPRVFHLNNQKHFRQPVSDTFHGRDVFAAVAAALSTGIKPEQLGVKVDDYVRLPGLRAEVSPSGVISGRVIHIDHFGNCITNITVGELTEQMIAAGARLTIGKHQISEFHRFFAEAKSNKPFCVWGSAGYLEIAAKNHSAAKLLKVKRGDPVLIDQT